MSFAPLRCCNVDSVHTRTSRFPDGQDATYMTWWRCPTCGQLSGDMGSVLPVIPSATEPMDATARAAIGTPPADLINAAREAHTRGLVRRALALLDLAIEAKPNEPAAYAEKGRQLFYASFPEHAATLLKRAITLGDQTPSTHGWLGAVLADTPEQRDAVPLLQRAVQGDLDGGMWWHSWVRLLVRLDRIDEADAELAKALALPIDAHWRGGLLTEKVNVLCARKQAAEALKTADEALTFVPTSDYAHFVRGRALGMLGRLDEAEAEMNVILQNTPNHADATRAKQLYAAARARRQGQK